MNQLSITYRPVSDLSINPRNARTHDRRQLRQIRQSIESFGFSNPLLVDEAGMLIAGHGRLAAARDLGLAEVPVIVLRHLSDAQKRALMLADNKIALNAGWDMDRLSDELGELLDMELDFDLQATGFEVGEIDVIIESVSGQIPTEAETAPSPDEGAPIVTRLGDLWQLGPHRVLCGNARGRNDFLTLLDDRTADMVFTDPPYNLRIRGQVSGKGRTRHREFHEASGEMSGPEFSEFLDRVLGNTAGFCRDGAVAYVCIDWRHLAELLGAGQRVFEDVLNLCVWAKTNGGMGSLYRSRHELIFVFRKGRTQHCNNVRLGQFGRNRTNVWCYPGVNTFREGRMEDLSAHPTAKPVAMIRDAILDVTKRGDLVLDPFLGGGASLIAAEKSGRVACGMDIDPAYVDVALRRWRGETGEDPRRMPDDRTLSSLEAELLEEANG